VPAKSTVIRNGRQIEVLSEEIVVGDIVILK
jgi:magnesium-transporting ATPase (P-type)